MSRSPVVVSLFVLFTVLFSKVTVADEVWCPGAVAFATDAKTRITYSSWFSSTNKPETLFGNALKYQFGMRVLPLEKLTRSTGLLSSVFAYRDVATGILVIPTDHSLEYFLPGNNGEVAATSMSLPVPYTESTPSDEAFNQFALQYVNEVFPKFHSPAVHKAKQLMRATTEDLTEAQFAELLGEKRAFIFNVNFDGLTKRVGFFTERENSRTMWVEMAASGKEEAHRIYSTLAQWIEGPEAVDRLSHGYWEPTNVHFYDGVADLHAEVEDLIDEEQQIDAFTRSVHAPGLNLGETDHLLTLGFAIYQPDIFDMDLTVPGAKEIKEQRRVRAYRKLLSHLLRHAV